MTQRALTTVAGDAIAVYGLGFRGLDGHLAAVLPVLGKRANAWVRL